MAATREDIRTILRQLFVRNMTSANADQAAERFLDLYFSDDAIDMSDAEISANTLTAANGVTATAGGVTATAGGLTVTAGGATVAAGNVTVDDNVIVTNGTLYVNTGGITCANGNVTIDDNVTVTNGALTVTAGGAVVAAGNVTIDDNVIVTNGTLYVNTGGITCANGNVTIDDNVVVTNGNCTVSAGTLIVGAATTPDTSEEVQLRNADGTVIQNATLGSENLNETDFATHAKWDVAGEFDDSGGNGAFTYSATGAGTWTQTAANRTAVGVKASRWYKLAYTVAVTVAPSSQGCTLTTGIANAAQTLDITAGSKTLYFLTNATVGDFVIDVTGLTAGEFTIDDVSLKEVTGGNWNVGGSCNANVHRGAFAGIVKNWTTAGPTDDLNVEGVSVLTVDASGGSVTIGGFAGGVTGQILHVIRTETANSVIIEDTEGGGSQDIKLADEADQTLNTIGGWCFIFDGTNWIEVGY